MLEAIRELGLELQIIFNKGAVMVLPAGVSKASGLEAALALLKLSPHNLVGIGDIGDAKHVRNGPRVTSARCGRRSARTCGQQRQRKC